MWGSPGQRGALSGQGGRGSCLNFWGRCCEARGLAKNSRWRQGQRGCPLRGKPDITKESRQRGVLQGWPRALGHLSTHEPGSAVAFSRSAAPKGAQCSRDGRTAGSHALSIRGAAVPLTPFLEVWVVTYRS